MSVLISEILRLKADYPVRLIALSREAYMYAGEEHVIYEKGDEVGIEAIDFSASSLRMCNKNRDSIFEIRWDSRKGGALTTDWRIKPKDL